ncbi:MAG: bifunctional oligoribonuclease/PAP phosphatase NrnA [Desulfobulbaceae bacterium]|nr:bifunctional oligoribonuclease/PAP phosphatase NrnA [Desulfobulbaceae bacterium]
MNHPLDQIVGTLRDARRVLVATHIHPDGDALGSQLGLGFILEAMGKEVFLYSESEISHLYAFLPGGEKLRTELPATGGFDCAVALDCGDCFRLGVRREELLAATPFVVIDHHAGHQEFGGLRWVDAKRASTGEMVYDLAQALGVDLSYDAAYCLYAAIVSDTGSFKYSSTTTDTFRVAGELVAKGVKPSEVAGKLFDNFSVNRLRLLTDVLETLSLHADDRLALITVSQEMFGRTGTEMGDTETFINYPRSLSTVKVAVFFKEGPNGMVSVSMRSKGTEYDVAELAARFGGGGHRNAAGCKWPDATVEVVRGQLLPELLALVGATG